MSSTAKSIDVVVAGSTFIGLATPMATAFQIYLGEIVPIKHRGYWASVMLICVMPFQAFAPIVGMLPSPCCNSLLRVLTSPAQLDSTSFISLGDGRTM
jgi:hypothetical protein